MPTYRHKRPQPTATTTRACTEAETQSFDLPGALPAPIPLDAADALRDAADRGWIDVRAHDRILAVGRAAGAQATFTAQIKAGVNAPAVALALADGVIAAGQQEVLINDVTSAAFIRFLVAGDADAGVNVADLYIIAK